MNRGDVVIVHFPFTDGNRGKNRPALIVQNDRDNGRLTQTIVAMITGNTRYAGEATQLLVDPTSASGRSSGLHGRSAIKCCNFFSIAQQDVIQIIGRLSTDSMKEIDACLKAALQID
jgi:mRNA interferase MazF